VLTPEQRAAIRTAVLAMPPLTNEQVDAICDALINARARWRTRPTTNS